jgi:hypothetical protein
MTGSGGVSSTPRVLGSITGRSEYWIVRRSLSSGAHSRDPVADDDEREHSRDGIRPSFANWFALKKRGRSAIPRGMQGRPGARCTRGLMCQDAHSKNRTRAYRFGTMKRFFLRRVLFPLVRDDLFVRVVCFLGGLLFGGFGVAILVWVATHHSNPNIQAVCWIIAIPFAAWGALLVSRCALSAQSRLARFVDRHLPDGVGEEGVALIFAIYLPAALLTLFLGRLGIRGQRIRGTTLGKRTQAARPPDGLPLTPT